MSTSLMSTKTNQTVLVKQAIMKCLDDGMTNKIEIYAKVTQAYNLNRAVVRRISAELRNELEQKVKILEPLERKNLDSKKD